MKQSFLGSILIMSMSVLFLITFTYATSFTYEVLFEEERLESTTQIASVDVSEMSREEARALLEEEVVDWQQRAVMEITWFDEVIELPGNAVDFQIDDTLDRYFDGEPVEEGMITSARTSVLEDELREIALPENMVDLVDMTALEQEMENQASTLEMEILIPLHTVLEPHHRLSEEEMTTISRTLEQGPLLTDWLSSEPEIEVAPYEVIHLSEFIYTFNGGELMNVVSSAVYEAVLHADFDIIERHIREQRYPNVALGFDAYMNEDERDLVFRNPMDVPYTISFHDVQNGFEVRVTGFDLPYRLEVTLEDQSTVEPKTRVTYSDDLPAGEDRIEETGTDGEFVRVVRSRFNDVDELIQEEEISRDFYKPEHRLEVRSIHEPEPEPDEENGNGFNGGNGSPGGPGDPDDPDNWDENGDWTGNGEWDENGDWNGDWNGNGNGESPPSGWSPPGTGNGDDTENGEDRGSYDENGTYIPPSTDDEGNEIKGH
ncbi:VanW family protein [Salisediminibacterium beveridgei]|uniref:Uncharacterized protein n=1 Tax=Salisediminibacterium beveridgei TaxID=632773 RepID=A0A1D7QTN3_9BACI|nr:VanW family protein [Salisediminibacterium beveridgei]AOM82349.1 hypothetical protein BBEV_0980 [Salisediminibacterium beveridgei]